jgi:hypothetical protein
VDQMEFNHQTGARISAARRINDRDQIEVNWLGCTGPNRWSRLHLLLRRTTHFRL